MLAYAVPQSVLLILVGSSYALATMGMKLVSGIQFAWGGAALILAGLALAATGEIALLKDNSMSELYLILVGVETALVLIAALFMGERITPKMMIGGGLIISGMIAVSH
ncbi:hypothetical protein EDD53_1796 [Pacificibacter maritimus]|uniref:Uncharacterized protein n=1 Tax=Pacificibacter maritimus TaxID=762213 RepID=A0A3N4UJD7_9RHOB|nr:hypothetical protein [Pacificibacter maritimus]RPE67389.1 hypothetical protein EDD53_1796 [Pacificibacter maritimus]